MITAQACEICGSTENIDAHHDDYSRPLDLRWLCRSHHRKLHAELARAGTPIVATDAEKAAAYREVNRQRPHSGSNLKFRMEAADYAKMQELASGAERSVAAEIRLAIREYLKQVAVAS